MGPRPRGAVTGRARRSRPRPRSLRSGAFFIPLALALALVLDAAARGPTALAAQDPDTVRLGPDRPDTLPRPPVQDTIRQDTVVRDTVILPPRLPVLDAPAPSAWAGGVWEWHRQDLLRLPDLTLLQLLERVPGLGPVRPGLVGQAESATVFGHAAAAIEYVVDGFELDPLVAPTFDPSRLPLLALRRVRIERRVTGATVRVETLSPVHAEAQSVIEAGTGDLGTNLFRGIFMAPYVLGGPLALGFERLASESVPNGGSNHTVGWLKYTFVRDSAGLQLEYRQSGLDRDGVGPPFDGERRDWALRARTRLGPFVAEAYGGATTVEDEAGDLVVREASTQGGVRLATRFGSNVPLDVLASARFRSHPRMPGQELELQAWFHPTPWLGLGADVVQAWWDGATSGRWSGEARIGPLAGLTAFAGLDRAGALLGDGWADVRVVAPAGSSGFELARDGSRFGAEWIWRGLRLGGAAVRTTVDSTAAFGLAFDPDARRIAAGEATGYELVARVPTGLDPLWLEGWFVGMDAPPDWLYLPEHQWEAALVYHHLPLPSGNLELYLRAEQRYRSGMAVPGDTVPVAIVAPSRTTNLELSIRVVTVRAFVRWENLLNRFGQQDLPGFPFPRQNILYGVKWEFRN